MRRKFMKDKLNQIAAELEKLRDEVGMLASELPEEDPCHSDSQLREDPDEGQTRRDGA